MEEITVDLLGLDRDQAQFYADCLMKERVRLTREMANIDIVLRKLRQFWNARPVGATSARVLQLVPGDKEAQSPQNGA